MEDEPLLHPRKFDDLVLEYFFGDGHRESFPNRNPHMKRLMHMMISMRKSTIAQPFQTRNFCLEMSAFVCHLAIHDYQAVYFVGCFVAHVKEIVGSVTVA